uniref:Uncharacterized protein n=1 Tax=Avena sativa TaxID=4498 RepID=A0ACD5YCD7_AVESA
MTATSILSSGPAELAGVRRRRHKLILSYLSQQRLDPAFQSMVQQTDAHMCGDHLRRLVSGGQWVEAVNYLHRFNSRRSVTSNALYLFLHTIWALENVAAGASEGSVKSTAHRHGMTLSMVISRCAKLGSLLKGMVDAPQQRVSLDWKPMRISAAIIASRLAREDPELNRLMQLPGDGQMLPHHLLPISPRRRPRHLKRPPGRRPPGRGPAIARLYLIKRRSLHSSSPHTPAFMDESLDRVAGLVDECLKAGKRQKLHQGTPLKSFGEVPGYPMLFLSPPGALVSQTNSRTTAVQNAGATASSLIMPGTFTD